MTERQDIDRLQLAPVAVDYRHAQVDTADEDI